jgi:hypothetical protein
MAEAYLKKPKYDVVVHFKDGNTHNLELSNIEYISKSDLAIMHYKRKPNNCDTEENRQIVYEELKRTGVPMTMVDIANNVHLPYSAVRYSIYHLIQDGKVWRTKGGFILL